VFAWIGETMVACAVAGAIVGTVVGASRKLSRAQAGALVAAWTVAGGLAPLLLVSVGLAIVALGFLSVVVTKPLFLTTVLYSTGISAAATLTIIVVQWADYRRSSSFWPVVTQWMAVFVITFVAVGLFMLKRG